jgi:hypothetical protein
MFCWNHHGDEKTRAITAWNRREQEKTKVTKFWISWHSTEEMSAFELNTPWWISGYRGSDDAAIICAAVKAASKEHAEQIIYESYDNRPASIEFRFCDERPDDWTPFCDRFKRAEWMSF